MRTFLPFLLTACVAFSLAYLWAPQTPSRQIVESLSSPALPTAAPPPPRSPSRLGPIERDEVQGHYTAMWGSERQILTLDPRIQEPISDRLEQGKPLVGATVVLEAKTGQILAVAEYSQRAPEAHGVAWRAEAPAASIYKLISAAALLELGVAPEQEVCVHGGTRRLAPQHLRDGPQDSCVRFADVIPLSLNAAMAKLVDRYLPLAHLGELSERLAFNHHLPGSVVVEPSPAQIPVDRFGRANTAAGFGDVKLSAVHAASLVSVIANHGHMIVPRILQQEMASGPQRAFEALDVLDPLVCLELAEMMRDTVRRGTARRVFGELGPNSPLHGVSVAAKTGSLLNYDEHVDHSWMVAFAPVEDPQFIVATVLINDWQLWYTKAGPLARHALETAMRTLRD